MAFLAALPLAAQYDSLKPLTPELILLARIRNVALEDLRKLPNFTCLETIERSRRSAGDRRFRLVDSLRIEVALVNGDELYAWPGSKSFEQRDLQIMVGGGMIGTGDFALHVKSIFISTYTRFDYRGVETVNGRRAHKFHYQVAMGDSHFLMRVPPNEGNVGYQGHIWNDAETMELLRLEMLIDEIPPQLPLRSGFKTIDFARVDIGGEGYLMPVSMDMTLTGRDRSEDRNRLVFSGCRQYQSESTVTFEDPVDLKPREAEVTVTLPANLEVPLRLKSDYAPARAARGDRLVFEVSKTVARRGLPLLPKGAEVAFRLENIHCDEMPVPHCFLALGPDAFRFENKSGRFLARLEFPLLREAVRAIPGGSRMGDIQKVLQLPPGSESAEYLLIRASKPRLPKGYPMVWRTLETGVEVKP